ncbi:DUF397 domain-containing protein [Streptomyces graminilatus]|uniref:DUF397 domain-containing protein n=1 Tax=Streptomyces graminilatus TaxID=1464070 RepID=UPI0006E4469D|nr:DUF397 domain-containing protein [Streptomyces graminilatus]
MNRKHLAGDPSELAWFKSSYSDGTEGDSCVEVALAWFKSSYSSSEGDSCVEIATAPGTIHVRDSKHAERGPRLAFAPAAWAAFVPYSSAR